MGACFEVYKEKGCGFLEAVYQECLEIELELRGIPFKSKAELSLSTRGESSRSAISQISSASTDHHRDQGRVQANRRGSGQLQNYLRGPTFVLASS